MRFTSKDVGCHADGTFGHQHCREKLSKLIQQLPGSDPTAFSLVCRIPDDAWDERQAMKILQSHTDDGLVWEFRDGDLMLSVAVEDLRESTWEGWCDA